MTDELIYRLYLGKDCFPGCRRSEFLEELVKLVPMERVKFNKHAESIVEMSDGRISLGFRDGTTEVADVGKARSWILWCHSISRVLLITFS